ncbi:MAG: YfhO family protein [Clostridia bacterium]|nr:YfhO family protein [Clostridia bacterium]
MNFLNSVDFFWGKWYNKDMEEAANRENGKFLKDLGGFFKKNYPFFLAPAIVIGLYWLMLGIYGVYPFGDKYTAASFDLSAQICPFIEHLFSVFKGEATFTYSYAVAGGADVTGTLLYCILSPFSFLFLLCGEGRVAYASSIVLTFKLATIAFSGTWFAKKLFQGIPNYLCTAIGVAYAYCGYTFVANTYINWLDLLIYLPFAVGAFRRFVKTGKFLRFSLLMACCIYTSFSIACFSMFTVFPVLIAYALLCVKKEERSRFIAYLGVAFLTAILLALPILLPSLMAYARSGREGGLFEYFWYGFGEQGPLGEWDPGAFDKWDSSAFKEIYTDSLYQKWSYILSDSIFVLLTLVWFYRKGFKDNFTKFMLTAGVFTLLPLVVDEAMLLMNMGSYMSYALRFGFLNAVYFLGGACLCLENICYKPRFAFDGTRLFAPLEEGRESGMEISSREISPKEKKIPKSYWWFVGGFSAFGAAIAGFLIWFSVNGNYHRFFDWFSLETSGFSSKFAHSYGGMEVVAVLFALVGVLALIGIFLVSIKKISPRFLSLVLVFVVGVQVFFYNERLVAGNCSTQHVDLTTYQTITSRLDEVEGGYYRIKDFGNIEENDEGERELLESFTTNAALMGGATFGVFSSVIDADNFIVYDLFGYVGNGKNLLKSLGTYRAFGDAFLGYKYVWCVEEEEEKERAEELGYLKPVMVQTGTDEAGEPTYGQLSEGGYCVYENELVFPLAYVLPRGDFSFEEENTAENRTKNQKALYEFLGGKPYTGTRSPSTSEVKSLAKSLQESAADIKVGAGKITARVTAQKGECLFLNFVASKGYTVTVNGKAAKLVDNDLRFLAVELEDGVNEVVFEYASPYVKYAAVGAGAGLAMLCALAFVVKKTRLVEKCAPVIAWAGIGLAVALAAFFMVYPTGAFVGKFISWFKGIL